jgi:hypothetical protein
MSKLSSIISGREQRPLRMVIYGVDGIGKSTFAAAAPGAIAIPTEDGSHHIDVARFPVARTHSEVLENIAALGNEKHDFQTVNLDSIDFAEALIREEVCREKGWAGIEDPGYGKGYAYAREKFDGLLSGLDWLWSKGMNVVVIGHAAKLRVDDPTTAEPYEKYGVKLDKMNGPKLCEWADVVAFANYETVVKLSKDGLQTVKRGISYGDRYLYTTRSASYDAKNRFGLPDKMPLDFGVFWENYQASIA